MGKNIFIGLVIAALVGCTSKPYVQTEHVPAEEELSKRKCKEVTTWSKLSSEAKSALKTYHDNKMDFNLCMGGVESDVSRDADSLSSVLLKRAERSYEKFIDSDKLLSAELGECYPELREYSDLKKNISRFENLPEDAKKVLRNVHAKKQAQIERDEKVEKLLKTKIKAFENGDVKVQLIQTKGKIAVIEITATGHKIVRYNINKVWQDQITGEVKRIPFGFTMTDDFGNNYFLINVTKGDYSLSAYNDSIRPGQSVKLSVIFSDWPVDSKELRLRINKSVIGEEITFRIPTEIWNLESGI